MSDFEQRLSEALARKSIEGPAANGLAEAARTRHHRRRATLWGTTSALAVAAVLTTGGVLASRDQGPSTGSSPGTPTVAAPTAAAPTNESPTCAELMQPPPPAPATPTRPVPDADAEYLTVDASGAVAAWFNQTEQLPELIVYDLARGKELAREDLGVTDVAGDPSLRILGQALYYRSAADPEVWMRYSWVDQTYPLVYRTCRAIDRDETRGGRISAGDVTIVVSEPTDSYFNALGGGRLEVVGGCLGASGSVIVWPNGTTVLKDEPLTIDIPTYGRFSLGDNVRIGGGYVLEHSSDDVEPGDYPVGGVTVPAECAKHDIFVAH